MRLIDLDPSWAVDYASSNRHGMGITFRCPHCQDQYLGIWFANPVDGGPPIDPKQEPLHRWVRTGDTFDTLTISPSIDASKCGHWHGFIRNGEIC